MGKGIATSSGLWGILEHCITAIYIMHSMLYTTLAIAVPINSWLPQKQLNPLSV